MVTAIWMFVDLQESDRETKEKLAALNRENEDLRAKLSEQTELNSYLLGEKDKQMEDIELLKVKALELVYLATSSANGPGATTRPRNKEIEKGAELC